MLKLLAKLRPRRSWFQLRLRTLLILMVMAAAPMTVCSYLARQARLRQELLHDLATRNAQGELELYDPFGAGPPGPAWLRALLGKDAFRKLRKVEPNELRYDVDIDDPFLARIVKVADLTHLNLSTAVVTNDGMPSVATCSELFSLSLARTRVTGEGLAQLANLPALQELNLSNTQVGDDGLAHLARLPSLRELDLRGTRITDDGLVHLATLTGLLSLNLEGINLSDRAISHLARLTALKSLYLQGTTMSDEGVAQLGRLVALRNLSLTETPITGATLGQLKDLENLNLTGCRIDDAGLQQISQCNLWGLHLYKTLVTDEGLKHLAGMKQLSYLSLDGTFITDAGTRAPHGTEFADFTEAERLLGH